MPLTRITTSVITDSAVTTAKIASGAVATADLADSSVTTAKIADSAVVTGDIANGAVTTAKLSGGQTGSAPVYGCRAWVNFDGTRDASGATSTSNTNRFIRSSGNVASVLRNGTGDYTITFTTAMADANYSVVHGGTISGNSMGRTIATPTSSSVQIGVRNSSSGALSDDSSVHITIFGN